MYHTSTVVRTCTRSAGGLSETCLVGCCTLAKSNSFNNIEPFLCISHQHASPRTEAVRPLQAAFVAEHNPRSSGELLRFYVIASNNVGSHGVH